MKFILSVICMIYLTSSMISAFDQCGEAEITLRNKEWMAAFKSQDKEKMRQFYHEGSILYVPGLEEQVVGPNDIIDTWEAIWASSGARAAELVVATGEAIEDMGIETGAYTMYLEDGSELDNGKYVVIWKLIGDKCFVHVDAWNSNKGVAEESNAGCSESDIVARNVDWRAAFLAQSRGDLEAFYAEDAQVMAPGGPPIVGRTAIGALWESLWAAGAYDAELNVVGAVTAGPVGVELGRVHCTVESGETFIKAKYVVIWRNIDGTCIIETDIFN